MKNRLGLKTICTEYKMFSEIRFTKCRLPGHKLGLLHATAFKPSLSLHVSGNCICTSVASWDGKASAYQWHLPLDVGGKLRWPGLSMSKTFTSARQWQVQVARYLHVISKIRWQFLCVSVARFLHTSASSGGKACACFSVAKSLPVCGSSAWQGHCMSVARVDVKVTIH